jgi:hypothetical protein
MFRKMKVKAKPMKASIKSPTHAPALSEREELLNLLIQTSINLQAKLRGAHDDNTQQNLQR